MKIAGGVEITLRIIKYSVGKQIYIIMQHATDYSCSSFDLKADEARELAKQLNALADQIDGPFYVEFGVPGMRTMGGED